MPRASARTDALHDLSECMELAALFQAIHDSDSEPESDEVDMDFGEAGEDMDIDSGPPIPGWENEVPTRPSDRSNQNPPFYSGPYEPFQFVRFDGSDPISEFDRFRPILLDRLEPDPLDRFDPIAFDRLEFPGPTVDTEIYLEGVQEGQGDSFEGYDLDYFSSSDSESDGEEVMILIGFMHAAILESRYFLERGRIPKSTEFRYTYFQRLPDDDFRAITRLSRDIFEFVVRLIEDDPIFANDSPFPQAPVHWQVACALDRLGNDGQGISFARSKLIWGLGHGTVLLYYRQVVYALCNGRNTFITWPDIEERRRISGEMETLGFKGAVGFVDGTTFPLQVKPSIHGNSYFDRKRNYSIYGQVVCDNKYMVRHFQTGMPGSCHDSGVFANSPIVSSPECFFSEGEYIISDSAYAASTFVVPAYRIGAVDRVDDPLEREKIEKFNTFLARARIVNEHTIGIMKARWASLCGLRTVLRKQGDILKVIRHVLACVILHNIAMERDPWELEDGEELPTDDNEAVPHALQLGRRRNNAGQRKRLCVRDACLAYHDRRH